MNTQPKINYQLELDKVISSLQLAGERKSVLLHSCCGPCSSYVVTYLKEYFDVTVLYYNPNIYPEEEYIHRLSEQARLLKELDIPLIEVGYDHDEFLDYVRGYEAEPEGGARCERCFELRLNKTYELAQEYNFDYICTTLTVSPHKNAMIINAVGQNIVNTSACRKPDAEPDKTELEDCIMKVPENQRHKPDAEPDKIEPDSSALKVADISMPRAGSTEPGKEGLSEDQSSHTSHNIMWLPGDFKKREGYKKSIELSKQYDLYRQEYCGCEFAK